MTLTSDGLAAAVLVCIPLMSIDNAMLVALRFLSEGGVAAAWSQGRMRAQDWAQANAAQRRAKQRRAEAARGRRSVE